MLDEIKKIARIIYNSLSDLLFPPRCPVCGSYIEEHTKILCPECKRNILVIGSYVDPPEPLKEVWRITKYDYGTRNIILNLKFEIQLKQLEILHKILNWAIKSDSGLTKFLSKIDIATPVPLHAARERERGFNQVELIFADWIQGQNIPMKRLLIRNKATAHLYDLNLDERRNVIKGVFALSAGADEIISGKRILILDDIFTTGTTMSECARVLKENGAAEIYGLALASNFGEINSQNK